MVRRWESWRSASDPLRNREDFSRRPSKVLCASIKKTGKSAENISPSAENKSHSDHCFGKSLRFLSIRTAEEIRNKVLWLRDET